MSFQYNSYRSKRYNRSRFLDGKFLLSQEATDLQLESLDHIRHTTSELLSDVAIADGWLVQLVPAALSIANYLKKLIVRPGKAYYDGLLFEMTSGTDHKVSGGTSQAYTLGSPNDVGGKILDFSAASTGYYKVIVQAMEEKITADQDTFIKGAAVPETTEEKRRLIYALSTIASDINGNLHGKDPLTFTRTDDLSSPNRTDFFSYNDKFQVDVTSNSFVSTSDTVGSSGVVTFSNTTGTGTLFPTGSLMSAVFTGGFLIDSNGSRYFINSVQVTTGPDQIAFTIDQELAVPAGTGLQGAPVFTSGTKYTLIPKDLVSADSSSGAPLGTRNYHVANVYWNGTSFASSSWGFTSSGGAISYNLRDLRRPATQQTINTLAKKHQWQLTGGGNIGFNSGATTLTWSSAFSVKDVLSSLEFTIGASDTTTLFSSNFVNEDVLYFAVPDDASGVTSATLQKDQRGTGDLEVYDPSRIYVLAYRIGNKVYFTQDGMSLIAGETKPLGAGLSNQNLTYIGAPDEATSAPTYTTVSSGSLALPSYNTTAGEDMTTRLSKVTAMLADIQQDENTRFNPGTITWDGSTVTITGASLSIPGTTVGASAISINTYSSAISDGHGLYVDISRTSGSALTLTDAALTAIVPSQQRLILVRRIGSDIWVR